MSEVLILPEDYRDLIMVSATDITNIDGMIRINQAGADWLMGKLDTGTYFDTLDEFGIDPYAHVKPVEELAFSQIVSYELFL